MAKEQQEEQSPSPKKPAGFQPAHDWVALKAVWRTWMASGRQPWRNATELSAAQGVPFDTFQKHAARWAKELKAEIHEAKRARAAATDANRRDPLLRPGTFRNGELNEGRLSAGQTSGPPAPAGLGRGPGQSDAENLRGTRQTLLDSVGEGVDALLDEIRKGKGSARTSAVKELFDRAGLLKASENKTEETPYEGMTDEELRARVSTLYPLILPSVSGS